MKKIVPYVLLFLLTSFSPDKIRKINVPKQGSIEYYFALKGTYKILSSETLKTAWGEIIIIKLSNLEKDQEYSLKRGISEKGILKDVKTVKIDTSIKIDIKSGDQEVRLSFTYYNKWGGVIKKFTTTVLFESKKESDDKKVKPKEPLNQDIQMLTSTHISWGFLLQAETFWLRARMARQPGLL